MFATEKALKDAGDKVPEDKKGEVEAALTEAKSKLQSDSLDEVKAATERLQNASHSIAQFLYNLELKENNLVLKLEHSRLHQKKRLRTKKTMMM